MREVEANAAYRWFLGYSLSDKTIDASISAHLILLINKSDKLAKYQFIAFVDLLLLSIVNKFYYIKYVVLLDKPICILFTIFRIFAGPDTA